MSIHEVLVVKVESILSHENADFLEIIKVSGYDYSIISKKGDFKVGNLGIYIEPDYCVPLDRPEFSFLSKSRITAKKLRGVWSEGLLIKVQDHHKLGDNVIEEYNIVRWEPSQKRKNWGSKGSDLQSGYSKQGPNFDISKYDLENYKKYSNLISSEDDVFFTIKIHGANARYVFHNGEMYCGSRTTWKYKPGSCLEFRNKNGETVIEKKAPPNTWWEALYQNPWIEEWCKNNPDVVVYGEIYGSVVQGDKFHYGHKNGNLGFRVFDVLRNNQWVNFQELISNPDYEGLKIVPVVYQGKFDKQKLQTLVELNEDSLDDCGENHIREGIVIKLLNERIDSKIGRVALKYVSNQYITRS